MKIHPLQWLPATAFLAITVGLACAQAPDQPPPTSAQSDRMPYRGAEHELQTLTRVLNLNSGQQATVKTILDQQALKVQALRTQNQGNPDADNSPQGHQGRREQMEQIRQDSDAKITAVLDDNQKKTFADWTARRKANMEHRRQHGDGPPPADGGSNPPPPPSR